MNVLVNGVSYSWANVKLVVAGVIVVGVTKISYKKKQKKEDNYGMGTEPVSRGYGNSEYEASITLYLEEWNKIIAAAPLKDPLQIAPFNIQVVFGGSRVAAKSDTLLGAEFMEDEMPVSQGDTKIMVTVPLRIAGIVHVA